MAAVRFPMGDGADSSRGPLVRRHYPRAATIIEGGRRAEILQTIVKGTAKLVTLTRCGRAVGLEVIGPGSPLGVESIVENAPFAVSVVSLEEMTCAVVPRGAVLALLNQRPWLIRELVSEAHERLVALMDRIVKLAGMRVEARFAHLFLTLADRFGHRENGTIVVAVPLLRQDLADFAGTALETSIRVMSRWEKQGIVRRDGRGFVIENRKRLEAFCHR